MLVDVMVPAYGGGPAFRETVHSVLAQTDPRWRLTVVDDGPGDLGDWLTGLGDERIRYLHNPVRLGINGNFARCAQESSAPLVCILGADDRLLPHYVGQVIDSMAATPAAAWVHPGVAVVDEHGRAAMPIADRVKRWTAPRVRGSRLTGGPALAASLLRGNWMYFPAVTFRGDVLRRHGFRAGHEIVLDLDLYLRVLLAGGQALLLERVCAQYRRHSASLSSAQAGDGSRFVEEAAYFREMAAVMAAAGWPAAARAARVHWTSRLHGVLQAGKAVRQRDLRGARQGLGLATALR